MRSDVDHVLFTSAYLLCLIDAMIFGYSTFGSLNYAGALSTMLRLCAAVLILLKLIFDRHYSLQLLLSMIAIGLLLLIAYVKSGYSHVFYLLIICLGLRNIHEERLISLDFWLRLVLCLLIVLCALSGIIENYITYRTGSSVLRYSLGFNHPNTLASMVLSLILEEAWIKRRRATGFYTIVIWIAAIITYLLTSNRTAVLLIIGFPLLLAMVPEKSPETGPERKGGWAVVSIIPAAVAFSVAAMLFCRSSGIFRSIDLALSNRFYNAGVIYRAYGIPVLGQQVALVSVKAARLNNSSIALLDVAYLRLLIQAGPIVLLLLMILYGKAMKAAWKKFDDLLVLLLGMFILFGLCESGFNNVFMNITLLPAAKTLFDSGAVQTGEGKLCVKT